MLGGLVLGAGRMGASSSGRVGAIGAGGCRVRWVPVPVGASGCQLGDSGCRVTVGTAS